VEEVPKARRNKPHHIMGVAWDLLTEEERRRVRLLPSAVENRGANAVLTGGNRGGGGGVSVGVDGRREATAKRMAWSAYPLAMMEVAARTGPVEMAASLKTHDVSDLVRAWRQRAK
jgi:hypothetical protein